MTQPTILTLVALSAALAVGCASATPAPRSAPAELACADRAALEPVLARFYAPGAVRDATRVTEPEFRARAIQLERTAGADLHLLAEPGMTAELLERALTCQAASSAPRHGADPLQSAGGAPHQVAVRSTGAGYAVRVTADSTEAGGVIWRRAQAMVAGPTSSVEQLATTSPSRSAL